MNVESKINIYEVDGSTPVDGLAAPQLTVRSHWLYRNYVVLQGEGFSITVIADELTMAIHNATNWKN